MGPWTVFEGEVRRAFVFVFGMLLSWGGGEGGGGSADLQNGRRIKYEYVAFLEQ